MTTIKKMDRPLTFGDVAFDVYEMDGLRWVTGEHLSIGLKASYLNVYSRESARFLPWDTREVRIPVWDYKLHAFYPRLRRIFSQSGALLLVRLAKGNERDGALESWLSALSTHE